MFEILAIFNDSLNLPFIYLFFFGTRGQLICTQEGFILTVSTGRKRRPQSHTFFRSAKPFLQYT
jgi:hypothetical protein